MSDSGKLTDAVANETSRQASELSDSSTESEVRFSVNQITTCRSSFAEDIANWQDAGVSSIGLWRRKLDMCGETEAVQLIRESGLDVSTLSFTGGFTGAQEIDFRDAMDDAWQALFSAAAVGARTLVVAPGSRGRYTDRHEVRVIVKALRLLAGAAGELGVGLAVLPMAEQFAHRWTTLHSLDAAWELVNRVERDNVGMVFDTFHFGSDPASLEQLPRFSRAIRVVQVSDTLSPPADSYDRCLPGEGSLPLTEIMATLSESDFAGDIDVQVWSSAVWEQSPIDVLNMCRHRMQYLLTNASCGREQSVVA